MANSPKDTYLESGSLAKPPRFNADNFPLWKSRMELFLSGSDPQIPYFLEHGPYVPTSIVPAVAATSTTPAAPKRTFVKQVSNWTDEDKRLVITKFKFMEALLEYLETYTIYLKMSKDIKTITLSELYDMMLNHEQTKSLKTNLIRDTKDDAKGTSLALFSDTSQPSQTPVSTVTITEIDDSDSDPISDNEADFNESLALLTKHFKKFGRKGNFRKPKQLSLTNKPDTPSSDKATSTYFQCQGKGYFATKCRYKKNQFAESSTPAYKDGMYQKLKYQRKGKGLIAEGKGWDESSDESSDEEDTSEVTSPLVADPPQLDAVAEESSSTVIAEPLQTVPQPPALRWTRDHPVDQVLGDPSIGVRIRHQASNHCLFVCFLSEIEPSKIEEVLADPFWVSAMQEELAVFERNLVWTLVHKPSRKTIIGLKWVFRNKLDENGTVIRIKARLVAQGYRQEEGIDYDETFAPLNKALYGLKQAPRAWYETLSTYLLKEGFTRGKIDSTLFVKSYKDHVFLAQIYVDDIIFGSTKAKLCKNFEALMQAEYKMSMMGELTYFLGLQVKQSEKGIFISQGKYVREMLTKFELTTCSAMKTPMALL
ncbi:hypothetical protein OSB04_011349 [Centaurea solstitialis]|uniref:Reverse transcriptase Ty1/copia-type domain-containing protein n=1 Tax=Centaurea solstitialis TaxID=347529 RepID=A0AA38TKZ4_9ASTR|nr:hypothetical protein OSB04_011349 [Centaurea solstitialis]